MEISKGRGKKGGKGVARKNDASLPDPELARVHRIPFMLGLPTAAPVVASFPGNNGGFLFITVPSLMLFISGIPQRSFLIYLNWLPCFFFLSLIRFSLHLLLRADEVSVSWQPPELCYSRRKSILNAQFVNNFPKRERKKERKRKEEIKEEGGFSSFFSFFQGSLAQAERRVLNPQRF